MRMLFKILLLSFVLIAATSCKAQMIQTVNDAKKLEIGKDKFIGKPLKELLAQIKPPVKRMAAIPGGTTSASHIFLYFLTDSSYHQYIDQTGKTPTRIDVQVAEGNFEWNPVTKAKGHQYDWTKEDEKKYGNLTVVNIRVTGSD